MTAKTDEIDHSNIKGWEHRELILEKYREKKNSVTTADSVSFITKTDVSSRQVLKIVRLMGEKINKPTSNHKIWKKRRIKPERK